MPTLPEVERKEIVIAPKIAPHEITLEDRLRASTRNIPVVVVEESIESYEAVTAVIADRRKS